MVRLVAQACARLQPDLFVVYLGNNEVVGPYGAGTVFVPYLPTATLVRAAVALRASRLGQLMRNTLLNLAMPGKGQPETWRGMADFTQSQVRASDPRMRAVYRCFESNLAEICLAAQRASEQGRFTNVRRPDRLRRSVHRSW